MARTKDFNCSPNGWAAGQAKNRRKGLPAVSIEPVRSAPFKPFKGFAAYEERRPGSHDYRSIPSMMGGERVPYHGIRGRSGA